MQIPSKHPIGLLAWRARLLCGNKELRRRLRGRRGGRGSAHGEGSPAPMRYSPHSMQLRSLSRISMVTDNSFQAPAGWVIISSENIEGLLRRRVQIIHPSISVGIRSDIRVRGQAIQDHRMKAGHCRGYDVNASICSCVCNAMHLPSINSCYSTFGLVCGSLYSWLQYRTSLNEVYLASHNEIISMSLDCLQFRTDHDWCSFLSFS